MFGLFGLSDSLVGEKLPENSRTAVANLFSQHYNVRSVTQSMWGDSRYVVELRDGRYLTVKVDTRYDWRNLPYFYIRSVD